MRNQQRTTRTTLTTQHEPIDRPCSLTRYLNNDSGGPRVPQPLWGDRLKRALSDDTPTPEADHLQPSQERGGAKPDSYDDLTPEVCHSVLRILRLHIFGLREDDPVVVLNCDALRDMVGVGERILKMLKQESVGDLYSTPYFKPKQRGQFEACLAQCRQDLRKMERVEQRRRERVLQPPADRFRWHEI